MNQNQNQNQNQNPYKNQNQNQTPYMNQAPKHNQIPIQTPTPNTYPLSFLEYQQIMYQKYLNQYHSKDPLLYYSNEPIDNPYYINEKTTNQHSYVDINEKPTYTYPSSYDTYRSNPYYYTDIYRTTGENVTDTDNVNIPIDKPSDLDKRYKSTKAPLKSGLYTDSVYDYEKSLNNLREKYGLSTSEKYSQDLTWLDRHKAISDELDEINIRQTELLNKLHKNSLENEKLYQTQKYSKLLDKDTPIYYTSLNNYKKEETSDDDYNDDESLDKKKQTETPDTKKKDLCFLFTSR